MLCIIDWDDTLFPTTHVTLSPHNEQHAILTSEQYKEYIDTFIKFITFIKKVARVVIITSSVTGWVDECILEYMPQCIEILQDIKIVHSDRQCIKLGKESMYRLIIKQQLYLHIGDDKLHVIHISDAMDDRDSINMLIEQFPQIIVQSVVVSIHPTLLIIIKQLCALMQHFDNIFIKNKSLDGYITIK